MNRNDVNVPLEQYLGLRAAFDLAMERLREVNLERESSFKMKLEPGDVFRLRALGVRWA
jgi:hypothetical protein